MPRQVSDQTERIEFRIKAADKVRIMTAASMSGLDMTSFVRHHVLLAANTAIERERRIDLSERNARRLIEYLDSPIEPNDRLKRAAQSFANGADPK